MRATTSMRRALRTKDAMLCGIDEGVLCRSLIVANK